MWRYDLYTCHLRDEYFAAEYHYDYINLSNAWPLNNDDLFFTIQIDNSSFDNFNNLYGEFKLHKYTNMDSINDI